MGISSNGTRILDETQPQNHTSAKTSINSTKVPAVFKKVSWVAGTKNIDWGGGKYDTATEYLKTVGVDNYIYDPYNRDKEHNLNTLKGIPFDTATCSNVLNVIDSDYQRELLIACVAGSLRDGGVAYFSVYEGDKSGVMKTDDRRDSCQLNRRLKDYMPEIKKIFGDGAVTMKHGIIIAIKGGK